MYTVKEAAQIVGLSEHTVRFYTDKGLVPNLQRDKNNTRLFDEESLNWLMAAKRWKLCGMSIEEMKAFVDLSMEGDSTLQERYEIILKQKDVALAQLEEAKSRADYLAKKADLYLDIMNKVVPDKTNPRNKLLTPSMNCYLSESNGNIQNTNQR